MVGEKFSEAVLNALRFLKIGKESKAKKLFARAVKINPVDEFAWLLLATLTRKGKKKEGGIELLRKAVALNPNSSILNSALAFWLAVTEKLDEARGFAQKSLQLEPKSAMAWTERIKCLISVKFFPEAKEAVQKCIELDPDAANWFRLGFLLLQEQNYIEAENAFRKSLEMKFASESTWICLGDVIKLQQKQDTVEAEIRQKLEKDPENFNEWLNLGVFLVGQDRIKEAHAAFKTAKGHLFKIPNINKRIEEYRVPLINVGYGLGLAEKIKKFSKKQKQKQEYLENMRNGLY